MDVAEHEITATWIEKKEEAARARLGNSRVDILVVKRRWCASETTGPLSQLERGMQGCKLEMTMQKLLTKAKTSASTTFCAGVVLSGPAVDSDVFA